MAIPPRKSHHEESSVNIISGRTTAPTYTGKNARAFATTRAIASAEVAGFENSSGFIQDFASALSRATRSLCRLA
jgi:hypothetical protein